MNRGRRFRWRVGVLCAILAIAGLGAKARQASDAVKVQAVMIQVKDQSGAAVAKAEVRVAPVAEKAPEKMETNDKGELALQLMPGRHALIVSEAGFANFNAQIEVKESGEAQIVPVVLKIGQMGGPVAVENTPKPQEKDVLILSVAPFPEKFTIRLAELKAMPRKTVAVHNPHANADETYEGVALADLLTKYGAPLGSALRGAALGYYVVGTGADGYKAVYSLAEVDPSFHGGDVLVVDTMDGKPLDARSGPLRLVSTEEQRPARGVRNLVALELKAAQ
ncbi:MAG: carboxypeptidase regulatory-like domain-containing protein [Candidatus Acidiferrum sp.]|jgi:hypothetical protein